MRDGDTIFPDASSTVYRVIPLLNMRTGITVVTNSPKAALELASHHIRTLATGGLLLDESIAFVGAFANQVIDSVRADIMLFSCRGVTEDGLLCDSSLEETCVRRGMLRNAKRKYLLCDNSKFGRKYPYVICHRDELDGIITESSSNGG